MVTLRPYQIDLVNDIRAAFRSGARRVCAVAPTGSGKTVVFSYITHHAALKKNRVLILTHRSEILDQISIALKREGCEHGIIRSGMPMDMMYPVQVASVQTLANRMDMVKEPDLIICDEFHHFRAKVFQSVLSQWSNAKMLGVTATPERLDGKGLYQVADVMVHGPSVRWLIEQGFLAKPVYYAPQKQIDVSQIKKTAGEFNQRQLADAVDKPEITGDAVAHYLKMCPGEQAIAFCVLLSHSEHICEAFNRAGIPAESIDGTMTRQERKGVMDRFRDGTTKILTSVDLIGEGVDVPAVGAAILLRPTQSLGLHLQQVGRCLRPAPGKTRAVILDHAGNCLRHGLAETEREWTLEDGAKNKRKKGELEDTMQCVRCYRVFDISETKCPECGLEIGGAGGVREVNEVSGELKELTDEMTRELSWRKAEENKKAKTLEDLVALGKKRGYRYPMQWASKLMAVRNSRRTGRVPVFTDSLAFTDR